MHCREVRHLLSAFYDDELSVEVRSQVSVHVESCSLCSAELASFRSLTKSARKLDRREPPSAIWKGIEAQLSNDVEAELGSDEEAVSLERAAESTRQKRRLWAASWAASTAALILISIGLGIFGRPLWLGHGHGELAADFSRYLDAFQENPNDAHLVLVKKYAGHTVTLDAAHGQLGYRPVLASGLPEGYTIQTAFVMEMPCCKCVKCVCKRSDGSTLAIFEHNDAQPIWLGDRVSIQMECGGEWCTLTQLDGHVAVSWKQGLRHFTIVGAKDIEEAGIWIQHFAT